MTNINHCTPDGGCRREEAKRHHLIEMDRAIRMRQAQERRLVDEALRAAGRVWLSTSAANVCEPAGCRR